MLAAPPVPTPPQSACMFHKICLYFMKMQKNAPVVAKNPLDKVIINDNLSDINWEIRFYNTKVEADTLEFPPSILANLLHILEMIEELGPNLGLPYTKPLGKGLFEIRSKGKEGIGRSLFCTIRDRKVIILHSFIKKTSKIPRRELTVARHRMQEVKQ
jgi:phage-related protein